MKSSLKFYIYRISLIALSTIIIFFMVRLHFKANTSLTRNLSFFREQIETDITGMYHVLDFKNTFEEFEETLTEFNHEYTKKSNLDSLEILLGFTGFVKVDKPVLIYSIIPDEYSIKEDVKEIENSINSDIKKELSSVNSIMKDFWNLLMTDYGEILQNPVEKSDTLEVYTSKVDNSLIDYRIKTDRITIMNKTDIENRKAVRISNLFFSKNEDSDMLLAKIETTTSFDNLTERIIHRVDYTEYKGIYLPDNHRISIYLDKKKLKEYNIAYKDWKIQK